MGQDKLLWSKSSWATIIGVKGMLPHVECAIWMLHEVYWSEQEWCYYKLHTSKVKLHGLWFITLVCLWNRGLRMPFCKHCLTIDFFKNFLWKHTSTYEHVPKAWAWRQWLTIWCEGVLVRAFNSLIDSTT